MHAITKGDTVMCVDLLSRNLGRYGRVINRCKDSDFWDVRWIGERYARPQPACTLARLIGEG